MTTIQFAKGHGTHNDFVLIPDVDGQVDLTPAQVAFLCDRRGGIGGDGLIRIVRSAASGEPAVADGPEWFMDYRNADGSAAEMCGNGTRVFAKYLVDHDLADGPEFEIATRAGSKRINLVPNGYRTDLGEWRLSRLDEAQERGMDSVVQVVGAAEPLPALSVDLGNPHTVIALPPSVDLDGLDLTHPPKVDPEPPHGTNVEFVRAHAPGHISMRVHERGVGETQSCGTGAAAAAIATWWWGGQPVDHLNWNVDLPGGRLGVHLLLHRVALSGPAQIVATGEVTLPE
ncbi:diaminopimelate epimerase [Leekyejoonella antrihumi]|uniref:diaminopimelate epimerase n=1 Tax=Leekyejoonella antrihumi TaxID=1660198 RepID=UPI001FE7C2C7|nr:diaminopimelate epimerase [Leekyejoonella antrihumi]